MGCGLPAAIGAALANPAATCLAICGDGGFAMTSQELMMAKVYKLNVKVKMIVVCQIMSVTWMFLELRLWD
jgi:acetolactate synthase-1/2/3 large subunit